MQMKGIPQILLLFKKKAKFGTTSMMQVFCITVTKDTGLLWKSYI